ncbi:MAG: N-acetylneuraminate synthase family protein [Elusimicrobiales bacterium]|nr:N-acetylneuraminate synthase family protein [Elusimicrobiales bacterium]
MNKTFDRLFILEMANNHMGDTDHGIAVIRAFAEVCRKFPFRFALKFQYRDIDTFIHPAFKGRKDVPYVPRFESTRLTQEQFMLMKKEAEKCGFLTACTPFDEISADRVVSQKFDIMKVASCSFTDWPLLEKIAAADMPVILSTAGAALQDIDSVANFLMHRRKDFALMHCVGEYPTAIEHTEMGQIPFLMDRYKGVPVGYSTHEDPNETDAVKMAIAAGASILERHIGLPTEKYKINKYSSTPEQLEKWLAAAEKAYKLMGVKNTRRSFSEKELEDLRGLRRGAFAKADIKPGDRIKPENVFFAIPNEKGQVLANDMSKYLVLTAKEEIKAGSPVMYSLLEKPFNARAKVQEVMQKIRSLVNSGNIPLPEKADFELSHHYGLERIEEFGAVIINCINREYCKKILIMLPGQKHPTHYHAKKEEAFHILYGNLQLTLDGKTQEHKAGEIVVVERGQKHSFSSENGAVFEEVSTTHYKNDSFYEDPAITANKNRKTELTLWTDWLKGKDY